MKKRIAILLLFLLCCLPALAQGSFVSSDIVKAMTAGKFYMRLSCNQSVSDEDMGTMTVNTSLELAAKGDVSMTRSHMSMMDAVMLTTDKGTYQLDENNKTWTAMPGGGSPSFGNLKLVRQGTCRVNGEDGWYFDEYTASSVSFTFYYNSNKVSIVEIGGSGMEEMGPMSLISCSSYIPNNMYFCVGRDWKQGSAGGGDPMAMAGMSMSDLEKQIRAELEGQELPAGMTVDDLVKMAMGSSNTGSAAVSAVPGPPVCARPWTDSGSPVELACGSPLASISITDKQKVSSPVYASSLKPAQKKPEPRWDRDITEEGMREAFEQLLASMEGKTDKQIQEEILDFNGEMNRFLFDRVVTGQMAEMSMARAIVYPHPALLNTTGLLLQDLGDDKRAEKYFEIAVDIEPNDVEPRYSLIECYLDRNDFTQAEKQVNKIIEITPAGAVDGHALLLRAMLKAQKGDNIAAADDLFQSLAAGYFDTNSASMIASLLSQMEAAAVVAAGEGPGVLDIRQLIDIIFCDENLALIRKGITYSKENEMHPSLSPLRFGGATGGNLESNAEYNRWMGDKYHDRAESYLDIAYKDYNTPTKALCWAMGADSFINGIPSLANTAYSLPDVQKEASRNASVRNAIAEGQERFAPLADVSGTYQKLSRVYGQQFGVDFFYIPDARTFWCLYLLNKYHEFDTLWAEGAYGGVDEHDNFVGCLPASYKSMVIQDRTTSAKYDELSKAMAERQDKARIALSKKVIAETDAWDEAHPYADADVRDRAHRRIARPLMIMISVTHPTEHLDDIEVPEATAHVMHYVDYYNATVRPALESWWKDIDLYSQYFLDPTLSVEFRFNTLYDCTLEQSGTYNFAAREGEGLIFTRDLIEKARCEIMDEAYKDRVAAKQAWDADMEREMQEEAALPKDLLFGMLSSLTATLDTAWGTIDVGFMDGKWGVKYDPSTGFSHLDLAYSVFRRGYGLIPGVDYFMDRMGFPSANPVSEYNALQKAMQMVQGHIEGLVKDAMGVGGIPGSIAIAAVKAKAGTLVKTDSKTLKDEVIRDAAGNMLVKHAKDQSVTLDGYGTYTRRDIQVGRAKLRRDTFTFPTPFGSVNFSQYANRRRGR